MTDQLKHAAQNLLHAIENEGVQGMDNLMIALRTALAQQQAEPIGWLDGNDKLAEFMHRDLKAEHDKRGSATPREFTVPVYTAPPQQQAEPDRRDLQAAGTHPAPCARHCEAKAFEIEIRSLKSQLKQQAELLTDKEITDLMPSRVPYKFDGALLEFARAIEAATKSKI